MRAFSLLSEIVCLRFGCLILSTFFNKFSTEPNSLINSAAVLTPMLGTPGILSELSPASACTSITLSGVTPNFSLTSSMPISLFFIESKSVV